MSVQLELLQDLRADEIGKRWAKFGWGRNSEVGQIRQKFGSGRNLEVDEIWKWTKFGSGQIWKRWSER